MDLPGTGPAAGAPLTAREMHALPELLPEVCCSGSPARLGNDQKTRNARRWGNPRGRLEANSLAEPAFFHLPTMSNLQILRRDEVLPAELAKPPKSSYDGHTVHLFWVEQGPVKTFLCEGSLAAPQGWYRAGVGDDQSAEALYVKLPPGRTYLGLITNHSVFDFHGEPWLLVKGPLPLGTLDASQYPRLEV